MKPFRSVPSSKQPYFTPSQIDQICCDELRKEGLFPSAPEAIRIDRFIEKRFKVSPRYEDLPAGVLGFTRFDKKGVKAVVISAALHAHLFALDEIPLHLFDKDSHSGDQILCRDVQGDEQKTNRYDGRWWEFHANRAMGGLLCPRSLVQEVMKRFLVPSGLLGVEILDENRRAESIRTMADIFDVNPVVARIRISELFPAQTGQMHL
jgi:hypothetical protein